MRFLPLRWTNDSGDSSVAATALILFLITARLGANLPAQPSVAGDSEPPSQPRPTITLTILPEDAKGTPILSTRATLTWLRLTRDQPPQRTLSDGREVFVPGSDAIACDLTNTIKVDVRRQTELEVPRDAIGFVLHSEAPRVLFTPVAWLAFDSYDAIEERLDVGAPSDGRPPIELRSDAARAELHQRMQEGQTRGMNLHRLEIMNADSENVLLEGWTPDSDVVHPLGEWAASGDAADIVVHHLGHRARTISLHIPESEPNAWPGEDGRPRFPDWFMFVNPDTSIEGDMFSVVDKHAIEAWENNWRDAFPLIHLESDWDRAKLTGLPADAWKIRGLLPDGRAFGPMTVLLPEGDDAVAEVQPLPDTTIAVEVRTVLDDGSDVPVAGATVNYQQDVRELHPRRTAILGRMPTGNRIDFVRGSSAYLPTTHTDHAGRALLTGLTQGSITLWVESDGFEPFERLVELSPGAAHRERVVLSTGTPVVHLNVRRTRTGDPVARAEIEATLWDASRWGGGVRVLHTLRAPVVDGRAELQLDQIGRWSFGFDREADYRLEPNTYTFESVGPHEISLNASVRSKVRVRATQDGEAVPLVSGELTHHRSAADERAHRRWLFMVPSEEVDGALEGRAEAGRYGLRLNFADPETGKSRWAEWKNAFEVRSVVEELTVELPAAWLEVTPVNAQGELVTRDLEYNVTTLEEGEGIAGLVMEAVRARSSAESPTVRIGPAYPGQRVRVMVRSNDELGFPSSAAGVAEVVLGDGTTPVDIVVIDNGYAITANIHGVAPQHRRALSMRVFQVEGDGVSLYDERGLWRQERDFRWEGYPPGEYVVSVMGDGAHYQECLSPVLRLGPESPVVDVNFQVEPGGSLGLFVGDSEGLAVLGAAVELRHIGGGPIDNWLANEPPTHTDAFGKARWFGLAPGEYVLNVDHPSDATLRSASKITVEAGADNSAKVTLKADASE